VLRRAFGNVFKKYETCLQAEGPLFENIIRFKAGPIITIENIGEKYS